MSLLNHSTLHNYRLLGVDTNGDNWVPADSQAGDMVALNSADGLTGLFAELKEDIRETACLDNCYEDGVADSILKCVTADCVSVLSVRVCVEAESGLDVPLPPFSKVYKDSNTQDYTLDATSGIFVGHSLNAETLPANCAFEIGQ